jgi:FMN-dependent oxidoreductase (nitrilotriacetate monooxygenase family)
MFHLGWFVSEAIQGWGTPDFDTSYGWANPALHQDMARKLEAACFDYVLLEDSSAIPNEYAGSRAVYLSETVHAPKFDPVVVATFMAAATSKLGIIPTLTTTFYPPFILARMTQTFDLLTGGRGGWNIVTSSSDLAAQNFGQPSLPEHDDRYDIADEYLELCKKLWASWEPDAVKADIATGVFADHTKVHEVNFSGANYQVRGPLNVPPSAQQRPVLAQAGNSPRGRAFAAKFADVVLTPVTYPPAIKAYRDDVRRLAIEAGRDPDEVKVMALASPRIFDTEAEVKEYRDYLNKVPDRLVISWLAQASAITGIDLAQFPIDEPLPDYVQTNGSRGTLDWLRSGNATIRQIGLRMARLTTTEPMVGTADQIAAEMEEVMNLVGGDGFLIRGPLTPKNVNNVCNKLVPALQSRGIVRTSYGADTLRGHLTEF